MKKALKTKIKTKTKTLTIESLFSVIILTGMISCCTVIDNSDTGATLKKCLGTDPEKHVTSPVSVFSFYNPLTDTIYTFSLFTQKVS